MTLRESISEQNSKAIIFDGLDDAIIGMTERINLGPVVTYDVDKIITILCNQGLTEEQALEHFDYNILGGWLGEDMPVFLRKL